MGFAMPRTNSLKTPSPLRPVPTHIGDLWVLSKVAMSLVAPFFTSAVTVFLVILASPHKAAKRISLIK